MTEILPITIKATIEVRDMDVLVGVPEFAAQCRRIKS